MNKSTTDRLSAIRADAKKWQAVNKDARNWDTAFLLRIIDELILNKQRENAKK